MGGAGEQTLTEAWIYTNVLLLNIYLVRYFEGFMLSK